MKLFVEPSSLKGEATIPGSKSNTTRAVLIATLAEGTSTIRNALASADCLSTVAVCRSLGAKIEMGENWQVTGVGPQPAVPEEILNVGNSGTTFYMTCAVAGLVDGYSVITGDFQLRRRPAGPLIAALNDLGAQAFSTRANGAAPVMVQGLLKGGRTSLPGVNSQWLSPLLLSCPLAEGDTEITVEDLQERPYIRMTLGWLTRQDIPYEEEGMQRFKLFGGHAYSPFNESIPADWESACFVLVAAAITDSDVVAHGLDIRDFQGDRAIVSILQEMGAELEVKDHGRGGIRVRGGKTLKGIEIDCGDLPDAPPILAVLGCCAEGRTVLRNLGASRLKETNRPRSIYEELIKMGAHIEDHGESMIIYHSSLKGTVIHGHYDHRIVMATAVAGLVAEGTTIIDTAEYMKISFPNFFEVMTGLGARMERLVSWTSSQ